MRKILFTFAVLLTAVTAANAQEKQEKQEQYNQYGVKVDIDPLAAEAQDGILVLRSKNNSGYKIWFDNRVQVDGAAFLGEQDWADEISNGFSIRRARFAIKAQIDKDWYGEVDMDMANGEFELKDAIIRYTGLEHFQFQAGNFKEIFSIQRNNSSRYLQFIERPMVCSALAPSRSLGFNANYYNKGLFLNLGVHAQVIAGAEERGYVEESSKSLKAPDEGLSYTFKAIYQPGWNKENWGMHIGGAVSWRDPKTSDETYGKARFSTRNSTSINRKKYIDTGDFSFEHNLLYTGELAGYWGGFRGEAVYMANTSFLPDHSTRMFSGWYVQGGYLLFGGTQRYDGAGAKFTRVKRGQKWGDVELCARVEYINLNADKALAPNDQKIMGGSCLAYAAGLNYYINDHVKVQLNWQYNDNDRFCSGKGNKFTVGLDDTGAPTKNPYYTKGKAGVDYHMVAFRFEIDF